MTATEVQKKGRPIGGHNLKEISFSFDTTDNIKVIQRIVISPFLPLMKACRSLGPLPACIRVVIPEGRDPKSFKMSVLTAIRQAKDELPENETYLVGITEDRTELVIRRGAARVMPPDWKPGRKKQVSNSVLTKTNTDKDDFDDEASVDSADKDFDETDNKIVNEEVNEIEEEELDF